MAEQPPQFGLLRIALEQFVRAHSRARKFAIGNQIDQFGNARAEGRIEIHVVPLELAPNSAACIVPQNAGLSAERAQRLHVRL